MGRENIFRDVRLCKNCGGVAASTTVRLTKNALQRQRRCKDCNTWSTTLEIDCDEFEERVRLRVNNALRIAADHLNKEADRLTGHPI